MSEDVTLSYDYLCHTVSQLSGQVADCNATIAILRAQLRSADAAYVELAMMFTLLETDNARLAAELVEQADAPAVPMPDEVEEAIGNLLSVWYAHHGATVSYTIVRAWMTTTVSAPNAMLKQRRRRHQ